MNIFQSLVNLIFVLAAAPCIASYLGQYNNLFDMLSSLRILWIVMLVFPTILAYLANQRFTALVGIVLIVGSAYSVLKLYVPERLAPWSEKGRISILQMSVQSDKNRDYDSAVRLIKQDKPDVVLISDANPVWIQAIAINLDTHPYRFSESQYGELALFSRLPLNDTQIKYSGSTKRPRISAQVQMGAYPVKLIFANVVIPKQNFSFRNSEIADIAKEASASLNPVIVAGNLNCTPWSYYFERLLQDGNLRDTERGSGFWPTWNNLTKNLFFPIDHCLVCPEFLTNCRRVENYKPAEHLPVYVELGYYGRSAAM